VTSATTRPTDLELEAEEWGPLLRGERRAGRFLSRLAAASAAATLLGGAVAVPLSLAHLWRPVVALPVLLVAVALAVRTSRCIVARPMPPWSLGLCLLVAVGAGVWAGATHDQHVVLRRDAGSYALYGQQLASAHQLPIDVDVKALGGPAVVDDPDVVVASPGFYQQGHGNSTSVVPQFLIGVPAWLSVGMWLGGWTGLFLVPAVFTALAIVSVGALTAATVGPRWAPLVATAVAVTAPVLHAGRSTYSEPAALLALSAALTLLASATEVGRKVSTLSIRLSRRIAMFSGLLLGGAGLVRLDALREVVLMIPVAVLLAVRRHPAARPLAVGAVLGTAGCALVDVLLDRPYLRLLAGSLLPLVALGVLLSVGGLVVLRWARRRDPADPADPADLDDPGDPGDSAGRWGRLLPIALVSAVVVVGVGLATRPWWLVGHTPPHDPSKTSVKLLQTAQGLAGDGTQNYTEHSLTWVVWWVGLAALILAFVGAILAAYRTGVIVGERRVLVPWLGPFVVGLGSTVLVLLRPGITPDHPWADRRLVVSVLPTVLLLAVAAVAALVRLARRHAPLPVLALAVVVGSLAVTGPAVAATRPVAGLRTEMGEVGAVQTVCRSFHPGDVAILVGERAANEWPQLIRGVCHVPTAVVRVRHTSTQNAAGQQALQAALARILPKVEAGGGHVIVVSDREALLDPLGTTATHLVDLQTTEDPRLLTERPEGSVPLVVTLWSAPAPR
jgi:hypothetical protein